MPRRRLLVLLGAAVVAVAAPASAGASATPGVVQGQVIVRYVPSTGAAERRDIRGQVDATRLESLQLPRTEVVRVDRSEDERAVARRLERDPRVLDAEPNFIYRPARTTNDPSFTTDPQSTTGQWHLPAIAAPAAWDSSIGSDVVVAILDTGIDLSHEDLRDQIWTNPGEAGAKANNGVDDDGNGYVDDVRGWHFADGSPGDNFPQDRDGHGTHVSGLVAAEGDNGLGGLGVAWGAKLMPVAFINAGGGSLAGIIDSLHYASRNGANIVNGSFTGPQSALIDQAIRDTPNVLYVFAAGNDNGRNVNTNPPIYPCMSPEPNVVCVGASDSDDQPALFSNVGSGVDLFAPGKDILSTKPANGYGELSGTSMATPIVSGAAALLKSQSPWATPPEIADALRSGVNVVPALAADTISGGRLNLARSLQLITDNDPPAAFSLVSPADGLVTKQRRPAIAWSPTVDAHSGIARNVVTVDGRDAFTVARDVTSATLPSDLADGLHRISVVAEDRAGNRRESSPAFVRVDYTAPQPAELVIPDPEPRRPGRVGISWAAPVDDGGIASQEVLVDGDVVQRLGANATATTLDGLPHGRHLIGIRATDVVGNVSESTRVPVTIDARPPVLRLTLRATASQLSRGRLTVRCRPSEAVQGGCDVRVKLAGGKALSRTLELTSSSPRAVRVSKSGRRAIARAARAARGGSVRLVLTATATDIAGNTAQKTLRLTRSGASVRRALAR